MDLKGQTKNTLLIITLMLSLVPYSLLIAVEHMSNQQEVSKQLISIYFRAYLFVLDKIEALNISLG